MISNIRVLSILTTLELYLVVGLNICVFYLVENFEFKLEQLQLFALLAPLLVTPIWSLKIMSSDNAIRPLSRCLVQYVMLTLILVIFRQTMFINWIFLFLSTILLIDSIVIGKNLAYQINCKNEN